MSEGPATRMVQEFKRATPKEREHILAHIDVAVSGKAVALRFSERCDHPDCSDPCYYVEQFMSCHSWPCPSEVSLKF